MAIATRAGLESLTDWLNIPGSDGTGVGGAIGSLAMLAKIWYEMNKGKTERPPFPNVNTDKVLPKDLTNEMAWPEAGKMVQELLNDVKTNIGPLHDSFSKWLRNEIVWPEAGKMVETLPLGDTGKLDITTPATPPRFNENLAWPNAGKMVETLPLGDTGKLDVPAPVLPGTTTMPNYGTLDGMTQVETLPLGDTGKLDVTAPVLPGTTTMPNYGTLDGMTQVETLPLGDTGKLDVTAPIIDVRTNTGTTDITDVGNNITDVGTNEWVSGAINATTTWPNEGQMIESIPPYYNDGPKINWSGPMITDKTNENNEVTINPVTFDSFYDLIRAEQKARWDREDAIRKEVQEREDNAWQRAVADMRKAGINPNLVNAGPAESGGGISTATGMNYAMWESGLQKEIALLQQSIEQNFKGDENDKDRFVQLLGNVLSMFSVIAMFKGKI